MNKDYDYECPECGMGLNVSLDDISDSSYTISFLDGCEDFEATCPYCHNKHSMWIKNFYFDVHIVDEGKNE
jgi:pyruvate-formate lyase-activating enzyme